MINDFYLIQKRCLRIYSMIELEQNEQGSSPFNLLIRIEKSNKIEIPFQSAYIQIQHTPSRKLQIKSNKFTNLRNQFDTVWVQDFIYDYVQQGDQFTFKLVNPKHNVLGSKVFAIDKLMPYYNTGQLALQKIEIENDGKYVGEVLVIFGLFEKKDLLSAINIPDYSLKKTNKQWVWQGQKQVEKIEVGCAFCNCFQAYQIQELPQLRINRVKIEQTQ